VLTPYDLQGFFTVSPIPNAHDLISRMLALILDESDKDRNFVSFSKSDDIILIVSNMGGLSVLELSRYTFDPLLFPLSRTLRLTCSPPFLQTRPSTRFTLSSMLRDLRSLSGYTPAPTSRRSTPRVSVFHS
jgi:hypothetical protein